MHGKDEFKYGRDGLIMLIDATQPMFMKNKSGELPFHMCLKVISHSSFP